MPDFTSKNAWSGGYYELAIGLGPRCDVRLANALAGMWASPNLEGPYLRRDVHPSTQNRVDPGENWCERLFGLGVLANDKKIPCGSYFTRFDGGLDWLVLFLPLASLEKIYGFGGFPFSNVDDDASWRTKIDSWLSQIAHFFFERSPFEIGLIGFEVEFARFTVDNVRNDGIPTRRQDGILWPARDGLEWHPANV